MSHTPTPWIKEVDECTKICTKIRTKTGALIATLSFSDGRKGLRAAGEVGANADLIVEAVNAHARLQADRDALLEACKRIFEREGWTWLKEVITQAEHD